MLGPAQADPLGPEPTGTSSVLGGVGVRAYPEPAYVVGVLHDPVDRLHDVLVDVVALEVAHHRGVDHGHGPQEDLTGGAVDRDHVTLVDRVAAADLGATPLHAHVERLCAAHAGAPHAAGDDGGVGGLAAAAGEDALRGDHAAQVVGVGLLADQDHVLAALGPLDRRVGVEDRLAHGSAGGGVHAGGDQGALGRLVEAGEHQLGELGAGDPTGRLVGVDQALVGHVAADPERRRRGALADPGLEHPELAALDGELDVAHVAVVLLERRHDADQLVVRLLVDLLHVGQRHRVADARDDVLALGVLEVVAVHPLVARRRVAGEGDPGAGVVAPVAEDHRLHVDGGAEALLDPLLAAVEDGALGVPRVEDGAHRQVELLARVLGEVVPGVLGDRALEGLDQLAQVVDAEVGVGLGAAVLLHRVQGAGEDLRLDAQHGGAEHLEQPAVGVHREALVGALRGQAADGLVVEADVEDRLHHPGHRELRAGADADQQGVGRVAEPASHRVLERLQPLVDLTVETLGYVALLQVRATRLGRDREAGRDREPEVGHLREVGALATEEVLLVLVAVGEVVDVGHGPDPCASPAPLARPEGPAARVTRTWSRLRSRRTPVARRRAPPPAPRRSGGR